MGFDVSPGWRRALITEGGTGERMCARAEGGQRSAAATSYFSEEAPEDVVATPWISSGKRANHAHIDRAAQGVGG